MKVLRRFVLPAAGVVAVAMLIAIASPQAMHAVTAAVVQVVNTPTNAIPTMVAPAQAQIYESTCNTGFGPLGCELDHVTGQTLIIESVSIQATTDQGVGVAEAVVSFPKPGASHTFMSVYVPMFQQANTSSGSQAFAGNVGARAIDAVAPGTTSDLVCWVSTSAPSSGGYSCSVFGYLVPAQ